MNHIELKIDGEVCRFSWETGDGIEKVQAVVESFKQVMMDAGYQPETVNRVLACVYIEILNAINLDEINTGDNK